MLTILLVHTALAADPVRCVATLSTPTEGCMIRDTLSLTAGGRTEAAATKAARAALKDALGKAGEAFRRLQPAANPKDLLACDALVETAHVDCFPDAGLAQPKYCFVTLDDADCWDGDVLELEDTGWKVFDAGRKTMCAAVDERAVKQAYGDVETRRAKCAASCTGHTQVRCP
jgi:hypothetical protein